MRKRIFVTGGHYTPAKAVVDELAKSNDWEIFYVGRKFALDGDRAVSLEFQEMSNNPKVKFLQITAGRLQRRFTSRTIPAALKIPIGFIQSIFWMAKFHPDVVISFGGYVAVPIAFAAKIFAVPVATHEQIPAFDYPSNFINFLADKVLVSFKHLLPNPPNNKWIFTGNPLRQEIFKVKVDNELSKIKSLKNKNSLPIVYVTGGNQGSHTINQLVLSVLDKLLEEAILIVQTGDSKFSDFDKISEKITTLSEKLKERIMIRKFFLADQIGAVFSLADLVIGRSGANTVFEIAALGKPAILIPIPWVHDDEQNKNAQALKEFGGAIVLDQQTTTPETFWRTISEMLKNLKTFKIKAEGAKKLNPSNAAQKIVEEVSKLTSQK